MVDPELLTGAQAAAAVEDLATAEKAIASTLMFTALRAAIARDVDALHIENFLAIAPGSAAADVMIMNPPFSHALDFVIHGMSMAPTVIMLQRLNWLGPARAEWLRRNQPDVYVLPKRPSFTADGSTDATEYAWFVWGEWGSHSDGRSFGRVAMLDGAPLQPSLFGAG